MPDSQFEAIKKRGISNRKRKRKESTEESTWIQSILPKAQDVGKRIGYFEKSEDPDNNVEAREAAEKALKVRIPSLAMSSEQIVEFQKNKKIDKLMCNGMISNWVHCSGEEPGIIESSNGDRFLIPSESTFHVGDAKDVETYSEINEVFFDLVVADPPWFSQSVKRKKTYQMNENVLDTLDIPKFTTDDALIVFWITNRKGILKEMKERFETWNLELIATWTWLKMTTQGETVYDFDNEKHKVPFEFVIFGKKKESETEFNLPEKFVFASVPMSIHSHKPPLTPLLKSFGNEFKKPLELFARSLLPSTHSVGFEPFLLQSENVFISN
uniref:Methyltransferase-like protein 2 n=1 Tax=Caenorhabditis tropicalis TaxID=1561998 RepID=A0A1I7UU84_9PELO